MHTVKGTAMALQLPTVTALACAMEDVLDHARKTARDLAADERVLLLECGDALQLALHAIVDGADGPDLDRLIALLRDPHEERSSPRAGAGDEPALHSPGLRELRADPVDDDRTLRVSTHRLDELSALAAELLATQSHGAHQEAAAHELVLSIEDMQRGSTAADAGSRANMSRVAAQAGALHRAIQDGRRISVLAQQVIDAIRDIRLVPLVGLVGQLRRAVHDAAARAGKYLEVDITGEQLELDKQMVDVLRAPLVHLVRNAVDHGLEPIEERVAAGKPRRGRISIRFAHRGAHVAIEIADDGRGVDVPALAEVVVAAGALSRAQIAELGADAALEMMTMPNVSTRKVIGDLSGRGLGLDIVRREVEQVLRGSLSCSTIPGRGTSFTIVVPLSIATPAHPGP
jgi:two-component system chemotaxis sensor kinase CheA